MRRSLLGVFAVVILGLAATPYFIGMTAEKVIRRNLGFIPPNQINKQFQFRIVKYDRGWFRSFSRAKVVLAQPEQQAALQHLERQLGAKGANNNDIFIDQVVIHGPFIINKLHPAKPKFIVGRALVSTEYVFPDMIAKQIKKVIGDNPIFQMNSVIGFAGGVDVSMQSAKLAAKDFKFLNADWGGIRGNNSFSKEHSQYDMTVDALDFSAMNNHLKMGALGIKGNEKRTDERTWVMDANVQLPLIDFKSAKNETFMMKDLNMKFFRTHDDPTASVGFAYNIGRVNLNDEFDFKPFVYSVKLSNMDNEALNQAIDWLTKLGNDPHYFEKHPELALTQGLPMTIKLFKHGVQVDQVFNFDAKRGKLKSNASIRFPKVTDQNALSPMILQQIDGKLELSITQELMKYILSELYFDDYKIMRSTEEHNAHQQHGPAGQTSPSSHPLARHIEGQSGAPAAHTGQPNAPSDDTTAALQQTLNPQAVSAPESSSLAGKTDEELHKLANERAKFDIDRLIQDGYLKPQGDDYTIKLIYKQGKVVINGKQIDLFGQLIPNVLRGVRQVRAH